MKKTLSSGVLILAIAAGFAAVGCSKDADPPKVEAANAENTLGKKPVGVSVAGKPTGSTAGGSAPMGAQ
jgi:hypothetical protein